MASYAQIAQKTWTSERTYGNDKSWQVTFEKKDGTAQSYDVPTEGEWVIRHGHRKDTVNKPVKISQLEFKLKDTDAPLIDEIVAAGTRDIRVTITETGTGIEKFKGYVVRALSDFDLYKDVQGIPVRAIGALKQTEEADVETSVPDTFEQFFDNLLGDIDLPRPVDFYTHLDHVGRLGTNSFPEEMDLLESTAAGSDDGNVFGALKSMLTSLGWQVFQKDGRLIVADLYDRYNSRASITKYEDDGAGGYTTTTEDLRITLDRTTVVDGGKVKELPEGIRYDHQHSFVGRNTITNITINSMQSVPKDSELESTPQNGMGRERDVIRIKSSQGQLTLNADPTETLSGDFGFLRAEARDRVSGDTLHYDPAADEWKAGTTKYYFKAEYNFAAGGGSTQTAPFGLTDRSLPELPDGVIADIHIFRTNKLFPSTGATTDINGCEHDELHVRYSIASPDAQATRTYRGLSASTFGEKLSASFFIGDDDQYEGQFFRYLDGSAGTFQPTGSWTRDAKSGRLGELVAEGIGNILLGNGFSFTVRIRDTTADPSLLSVFELPDNDGTTRIFLPLEIRHLLGKGFYEIRLREVMAGFTSVDRERYSDGAASEAGVGAGVSGGGGSGAAQLNDLTDVMTSSPATDEGLFYDGTNFANRHITASDVKSGTFDTARIPNLDAAKITTGQFADGRISQSSVEQYLGSYAETNVSETITAPWTFSDDQHIATGAGTSIKQRISMNVAGGGGADLVAKDDGTFNLIPLIAGSQKTGVTLRYNEGTLRWEINGSAIQTNANAQDLSWSPSNNTMNISDGNNAQITKFGQTLDFEGQVRLRGSLEQLRLYNGAGNDYFHWEFDDTTYKFRRTDASVPDTQDIISVDFASGKITLWGSGAAWPEIAGSDIATEPWANGRFAQKAATQTITGNWTFDNRIVTEDGPKLGLVGNQNTSFNFLGIQSTGADKKVAIRLAPSGTATEGLFEMYNSSNVSADRGIFQLRVSGGIVSFETFSDGTGTPISTFNNEIATNFLASSDSTVSISIRRKSSTGRAQYTLEDETGSEIWRCGMTGAGSVDYAFYNGSRNTLAIQKDGPVIVHRNGTGAGFHSARIAGFRGTDGGGNGWIEVWGDDANSAGVLLGNPTDGWQGAIEWDDAAGQLRFRALGNPNVANIDGSGNVRGNDFIFK